MYHVFSLTWEVNTVNLKVEEYGIMVTGSWDGSEGRHGQREVG